MARRKLVECRHCGSVIAASAKTCPCCGGKNKKPLYLRNWFIVLVVLFLLGGCSSMFSRKDSPKIEDTPVENQFDDTQEENDDIQEEIKEDAKPKVEKHTSSGISPKFKEAMDAYEEYVDKYIEFLDNYDKNDVNDMLKYAEYMMEYTEKLEAFEDYEDEDLNDQELAYYLKVQTRVNNKLMKAAQ